MPKSDPFDINAFVQGIRDEVHAEYQSKLTQVLALARSLVSEIELLGIAAPKAGKRRRKKGSADGADRVRAVSAPKASEGPSRGRKQCPSCSKYVGVRSATCPNCGHAFERSAKRTNDETSPKRRRAKETAVEETAATT